MRVPMIVVSPWTRGGWVNSELLDHTSLIRFLETRFGRHRPDLIESNITPWRRAVVGDLTTAFDFKTPNKTRHLDLPDTDGFKPNDLERVPDQVPVPPVDQRVPHQERGVRPARALPYTLHADGRASGGLFTIDFSSTGRAAAVFQVRSAGDAGEPRTYTVGSGKNLSDTWDAASGYDLSVHAPNGFFRHFAGGHRAYLDVEAFYDARGNEITLVIKNLGSEKANVTVRNGYLSGTTKVSLNPGESASDHWSLSRTRGWYDLVVTVAGDSQFESRYAGHLENGEDSISDPAMGGLV
jgi:phospholipase C